VRLIVDASVVVKAAVAEDGHTEALALIEADHELLVPDLAFIETGNALWKKVVRGEISREQAAAAVAELPFAFANVLPASENIRRGFELAIELNHPIYDCLYLAAAEANEASLVTADQRLLAAVHGTSLAGLVRPLRDRLR